jgi:hypothetical protein
MPDSVSGWSSIWRRTLPGAVATSQPSRAAVTACIGCRREAASTCEVTPAGLSAAMISASTAPESTEMSSRRPMKQEM